MADSKIIVENLDLFIKKQRILKNINLSIPENQITVILGPSGCGKTTFLKCLNRLIDLHEEYKISGKIIIDNQDIINDNIDIIRLRQKIGLLSQRPFPFPMNIYNNIAYSLKLKGVHRKNLLDGQVEYYLRQASLWEEVKDRLHEPASGLSIGQQQRLCLARGLAVDPEIILADEPTSALDPMSSQVIESRFTELKQNYTIVVVTHILRQAKRIADYVIFMYAGEVIEQGNARDFFENPRVEITKQYLKGQFN